MKNYVIICSIIFTNLLSASTGGTASGMVSSSSAAYDGNALVLSGQVLLDHGLGKMHAEQAILEKQDGTGKEFPFSSILLKNKVELDLPGQAKLLCEHAALDFTGLKGKLSSLTNERVAYTDLLKKANGQEAPLHFLSRLVDLNFEKFEHDGQRSEFSIKTVLATGDVAVDYAGLFFLKAGKAIYEKATNNAQLAHGIITAYPTDEFSFCRIERDRDIVDAEEIEVDLGHTAIVLKKAKGILTSAQIPRMQQGEIHFHCDQALWDHQKDTIHLQGKVRIDDSALGKLSTEEELTLTQDKNGVKTLGTIGHTTLEFQDFEDRPVHKLICHGKIHIDHEKMHATFESPHIEGKVASTKQIYYEEGKFAVYADRGAIDYAPQGKKMQPSSISLRGNVRLLSCDASRAPRYGVADWMTYSPTTRTFILGAHPGNKVLFLDEKDHMRISAQEIHLTNDGNDSETVKGVGNVQFAFTADEEQLLKTLFGIKD